jgi:hypothetical protein
MTTRGRPAEQSPPAGAAGADRAPRLHRRPALRIRRVLLRDAENLNENAYRRLLAGLDVGDPNDQVAAPWIGCRPTGTTTRAWTPIQPAPPAPSVLLVSQPPICRSRTTEGDQGRKWLPEFIICTPAEASPSNWVTGLPAPRHPSSSFGSANSTISW